MDSDTKGWVVSLAIVAITIVMCLSIGCMVDLHRTKVLIENGYEQTMVVGNDRPLWVKVEGEQ